MFSFYLTPLVFLISQVSATSFFPRQTEPSCSDYGFVDCGANCLYANYTCCPDQTSGCLTSASYCYISLSNEYDCCALGTVCAGPDSADTTSGTTTSTSYVTVEATSPSPPGHAATSLSTLDSPSLSVLDVPIAASVRGMI